jgi:ribA/ribD-fused uncharacterized protein
MRVYIKRETASFFRTSEKFGAFSNMHAGFPLEMLGLKIPSTENYYQAMRYTGNPEIQADILAQEKPMMSKRVAYQTMDQARPDWLKVNIAVMRHALRLRYAHYPEEMSALFKESGEMPIVEISRKDNFWGTYEIGDRLEGQNILGRLWMELRLEVSGLDPKAPFEVMAPSFPNCILCGEAITTFTPEPVVPAQVSFEL